MGLKKQDQIELLQADLAECEAAIERGRATFLEVGQALARIQEERLYRVTHGTFELYCEERWGFTARRARQYVRAFEVTETAKRNNCAHLAIENEGQARALASVPEERREEVLKKASGNGKPTAKKIKEAAESIFEDDEESEPEWTVEGAERFEVALNLLKQLKKTLNEIVEASAGFFVLPERQRMEADIRNLRTAFKTLRPSGECSYCKGKGKYRGKTCDGCKGQGWCCVGVAKAAPKDSDE